MHCIYIALALVGVPTLLQRSCLRSGESIRAYPRIESRINSLNNVALWQESMTAYRFHKARLENDILPRRHEPHVRKDDRPWFARGVRLSLRGGTVK